MRLISNDILCRGAVTYGKLIHTKEMIFGPALVQAYETESKAALYPRIILSEDLINMAGSYYNKYAHTPKEEIEYVKELLKEVKLS